MIIALWIFAIAAVLMGALARWLFVLGDTPGDDFYRGVVYWLAAFACAMCVLAWIILALIHWWPK